MARGGVLSLGFDGAKDGELAFAKRRRMLCDSRHLLTVDFIRLQAPSRAANPPPCCPSLRFVDGRSTLHCGHRWLHRWDRKCRFSRRLVMGCCHHRRNRRRAEKSEVGSVQTSRPSLAPNHDRSSPNSRRCLRRVAGCSQEHQIAGFRSIAPIDAGSRCAGQ